VSVAVRTGAARPGVAARIAARVARVAGDVDARALAGLALAFIALAVLSRRAWGVPSVDAGHELDVAAVVAAGGTPYDDIRYFYGPLGLYSLAGAFAVLGTGFGTAFAFGLAQAAAIVAAFYALARRLLGVLSSFLATLIVAAIGFSGTAFDFVLPHTNSATFGLLALLLLLLALAGGRLVGAGLALGAACLTRPELAAVAVLAAVAFLVGLARQDGRREALTALPRLALPAAAIVAAVLGPLTARVGAERLFTENLWPVDFLRVAGFDSQHDWAPLDLESAVATLARATVYCALLSGVVGSALLSARRRGQGLGARLAALWPLLAAGLGLLALDALWRATGIYPASRDAVEQESVHLLIGISWLPALGFAAAAFALVRLLRGGPPPLTASWGFDLALIAVAAALGARAYDAFTAEASYAPYYAPPLVLLLALLHDRLAQRRPQVRVAVNAALAAVAAGLFLYAQVALYPDDNATVHTPRGSFATTTAAAPALQGAIDFVRSHTAPGEPVLAVPSDSGFNFMTERPAPLYDAMFLPGLLDSRADELAAIARLRATDVRFVVVDRRRFSGYRYERFGVDYNRMLAAWLTGGRPPVAEFGDGRWVGGTTPATAYDIYRIPH
jgi:4-amino-4-deoxy-L-arabinose transferase-like glycosyltransferase